MACGTTVSKYLVFLFNFLFFLAGVLLIVIGALTITHKEKYLDVIPGMPNFQAVAILFVVVGAIVTVIAFFGCCGAIQESSCMLNTFAFLLFLIILAEIGIAIAAFVLRSRIEDEFKTAMFKSLDQYDPNATTNSSGWIAKEGWDKMQQDWKCCGVENNTDWKNNTHYSGDTLPPSCCTSNSTTCSYVSSDVFSKGCFSDMSKTLRNLYLAIGVIGIVVGLVEVLGIVMACCLTKSYR